MGYNIEKVVPSQELVKDKMPLPINLKEIVNQDRREIANIIEGKDKRKLLVIGPCSAWPNTAVLNYAKELKELSNKYCDKIKIILRVYTQKPRTVLGWTGPQNQPNPFSISDIEQGIYYCREMMLNILELGLPIADEALFTHNEGYFDDLLSWVAIGARSSEDQEHRIYASMLNNPVGIKNPTCGTLDIACNSVLAAQHTHVFLLNGKQIRTLGNPHAHLVLRGSNGESNIFIENLLKIDDIFKKKQILNPSVLIDCSHDNSIEPSSGKKDPLAQPKVLMRVLKNMSEHSRLKTLIKGFMVESFILEGKQNLKDFNSIEEINLNGLSITDACISLEQTKKLLADFYSYL